LRAAKQSRGAGLSRVATAARASAAALALLAIACDAPTTTESTTLAPAVPDDMVTFSAGEFVSGCDAFAGQPCFRDEQPEQVRSTGAFAIDRTEVTVEAYRACVDAGACSAPGTEEGCNWASAGRERHPINCVDWFQAAAYCAYRGARLPTEWEWERAARGDDGRPNPWGDSPASCLLAMIDEGSGNGCGAGDVTAPVGSRPEGATPEGVVDLIGNVWEWTGSGRDGSGARVARGGAYYVEPPLARASFGLLFAPAGRAPFTGLRCAR